MSMPTTGIGFGLYGMQSQQAAGSDVHEASLHAVTSSGNDVGNPFLWLVGIAGVTIGLISFSVSARVGKFAAGVKAG